MDFSALDRHQKVALSFSGGKDSLACIYLMRPYLDRIHVYHRDTGDLLPEVRDIIEQIKCMCPHFTHLHGDVNGWIAENGMPTDLLPHSAHEIGGAMGEAGIKLVSRYACCWKNLMEPVHSRIVEDGNTLLIRGTKRVDMKRLPVSSGDVFDGIELLLPLLEWSHAEVFQYLRREGAPICRVYDHVQNAPECARCPAWLGEKRAAYLKQYHPALFNDYRTRLHAVWNEIDPVLMNLASELRDLG